MVSIDTKCFEIALVDLLFESLWYIFSTAVVAAFSAISAVTQLEVIDRDPALHHLQYTNQFVM